MSDITPNEFEAILDLLCKNLTDETRESGPYKSAAAFETVVRQQLKELLIRHNIGVDLSPQAQVFPDIVLGKFGVEVKFTANDTWRSIANSVFEGTRGANVDQIYVVFGKMGGTPEVRWGKYEERVMHVRTSHVPRFELEMESRESLFDKMGVPYSVFSKLPIEGRMEHIRKYARGRLKKGDRLWWLEDIPEQSHSLPLGVRLYMSLEQDEKRRLRAEAALLCPQIVGSSRTKNKYNDAAMYLLTYRGVLCPQARDLFSAGSVAMRSDSTRGGLYILRALQDIEKEMRTAAKDLDDALFVEYWEKSVPPANRIKEWLKRADAHAKSWKPSRSLFK